MSDPTDEPADENDKNGQPTPWDQRPMSEIERRLKREVASAAAPRRRQPRLGSLSAARRRKEEQRRASESDREK
jgi:hypothetical protein